MSTRRTADPLNPLGIRDLDHIEFCAPTLNGATAQLFRKLGLSQTHLSHDKNSALFTQGQIRLMLTHAPHERHPAAQYLAKHGEGACTLSFWVEDVERALEHAHQAGAKILEEIKTVESAEGSFTSAAISGLGDIRYEFISRPAEVFRPHFKTLGKDVLAEPLPVRAARVDHLTNNVFKGEMDQWADYYKKVFGMQEIRYFDIKGSKTGLHSRAMGLANRKVIIPINEPEVKNGRSQIQEYLDIHRGPGVQHIALMTPDIISTVTELRKRGIRFLDIPSTYYEGISGRKIDVEEDLAVLEGAQILVDGKDKDYLLQNFTDVYIGPLFFEFIQRKGHQGFGEGNFTALFESIERDQVKRGYLK